MNEEIAMQYQRGYIDGFKEGKAIFEPKKGCKGCIYENAMIYQEKDRRITEQTLKDIDRAFKALEEYDELIDMILAKFDEYDDTDLIKAKYVRQIIDKFKAESEDNNDRIGNICKRYN